jgi:hypothetical protein
MIGRLTRNDYLSLKVSDKTVKLFWGQNPVCFIFPVLPEDRSGIQLSKHRILYFLI